MIPQPKTESIRQVMMQEQEIIAVKQLGALLPMSIVIKLTLSI